MLSNVLVIGSGEKEKEREEKEVKNLETDFRLLKGMPGSVGSPGGTPSNPLSPVFSLVKVCFSVKILIVLTFKLHKKVPLRICTKSGIVEGIKYWRGT